MRLGYTEEAGAFMRWIEARCGELKPDGSLQIMYGLDGRHDLTEETLAAPRGLLAARAPVRIGNGAYDQLQLDIYGELMDSVYLYNKYGEPISHDLWLNLVRLIDWVCEHWQRAGRGHLGGARRAPGVPLLAADVLGGDRPRHPARATSARSLRRSQRWQTTCATRSTTTSTTHFWDPSQRAFVQHKGATTLDAAAC